MRTSFDHLPPAKQRELERTANTGLERKDALEDGQHGLTIPKGIPQDLKAVAQILTAEFGLHFYYASDRS